MIKKGQATLEFALVFIIVAFLIIGLLFLWRWSKDNIGARWGAFESQRVKAGTKGTAGQPAVPYYAPSPGEPQYLNR
jgi:uncharacterized protein (UPF0333 family)